MDKEQKIQVLQSFVKGKITKEQFKQRFAKKYFIVHDKGKMLKSKPSNLPFNMEFNIRADNSQDDIIKIIESLH